METKDELETHLGNRERLLAAIAGELFGPGSKFDDGEPLIGTKQTRFHFDKEVVFEDWDAYTRARPISGDSGEEVLKEERPSSRYGMGILFPKTESEDNEEQIAEDAQLNSADAEASTSEERKALEVSEGIEKSRQKRLERVVERTETMRKSGEGVLGSEGEGEGEGDSDPPGADLRLANLRRQRSLGVSFVVDADTPGDLVVDITGGRYRRFDKVRVEGSKKKISWWIRHRVATKVSISFSKIAGKSGKLSPEKVEVPKAEGLRPLDIQLEVIVRGRDRIPGDDHPESARLITVTLVNRSECYDRGLLDQFSLFQARLALTGSNSEEVFLPYPRSRSENEGEEQQSLDLLYRKENTFSTGHGCAGAWEAASNGERASRVFAEVLPSAETPSITPDLEYKDPESGRFETLRIPLKLLVDRHSHDEAVGVLDLMLKLYAEWIDEREKEAKSLGEYSDIAEKHVGKCREALVRMRKGVDLISNDPDSLESNAFRLTNRAMLIQALASNAPLRRVQLDEATERESYEPQFKAPDLDSKTAEERSWRPFQIAFLLMNLAGLSDESDDDRGIVDLIWFPTGGGKTEAYLGCAAYSMFVRRLKNPGDIGTQVLMRYTLRLLTAQQFQRASSLICAMEHLRSGMEEVLGSSPFTIGIWVGGETTPNRKSGAVSAFNRAKRNGEEDYKMILLKCPWCGAEMGPKRIGASAGYELRGVRKSGQDVWLHCPDGECEFSSRLPVSVVDEDIYESPPTYVIATVDKFASMAWREECRRLFGIGMDGERESSPPGLIIQDELHLITGPLGSMVGLYEALVDELATDRRNPDYELRPKLIAATATTRASDRQIRDLYARSETAIFPAPGLEAGDSFFARYSVDENGDRSPGRLYIGVLPVNYSSTLTASVRLFSSILAAALGFDRDEERDPWWSLLVFYNSLRELGGALTLFGADIPERLQQLQRRWYPKMTHRYVREVLELTGRLENSEVPRALEALERKYSSSPKKGQYPVDACLASNIIEVGVDVDRLGIMAVAGQPKTTAQYIQATGRVGRRLPGAIVTNYSAGKARDRSHYEHFQTYHSRLYAQVEPASVTPFTIPVLRRALHAIMVATARQTLPMSELGNPKPFIGTELESASSRALEFLTSRIKVVAQDDPVAEQRMLKDLEEWYDKRAGEWESFYAERWHEYFPKHDSGDQPLIRPYGSPCPSAWVHQTWEAPNSLRGVDSECQLFIPAPPAARAE